MASPFSPRRRADPLPTARAAAWQFCRICRFCASFWNGSARCEALTYAFRTHPSIYVLEVPATTSRLGAGPPLREFPGDLPKDHRVPDMSPATLRLARMEKKGYAEVFATPPPSIVHSSKQGMGQPESDQERRSKRLCRAVFWLGVIAAAPVLMWCCDRGLNEVHRRSVIRCFRAADRVIVEYAVVKPDDSGDPYTTHEITNREQLALIAQHVSRIQIDEFQSKFLFFPFLVGTTANWGLPDKVSVYNSHDVTPRQFCISPDCLYEIGREGRVFFHTGEAFRRALRAR